MNRHWSISIHLVTDQKTRIIELRRSRLSKRRILLRNDRSILLNKKNHSTERIERLNFFVLISINSTLAISYSSQSENQLIVTIHKERLNFFEVFHFSSQSIFFSIKFSSWLLSRCQQKFQSILIFLILKIILILTSFAKSTKMISFRKQ